MIIELNNNGHMLAFMNSFFDCSWISTYPDEDERLFCGGWMFIRIQSVLIVDTNQNFEQILHALFLFDSMLSGGYWDGRDDVTIERIDIQIIEAFTEYSINSNGKKNAITGYVKELFDNFIQRKQEISSTRR